MNRLLAITLLLVWTFGAADPSVGSESPRPATALDLQVVPSLDPAEGPAVDPFSAAKLPISGGQLLSAGVPFARGRLPEVAGLRVVAADGRPVPAQLERRGSWTGSGDVRWLGVVLLSEPGVSSYRLVEGAPVAIPGAVEVTTESERLVVENGRLRAEVARRGGSLRRVWLDGVLVLEQEDVQFAAFGPSGPRVGEARFETVEARVEKQGPLHTVIRTEGRYATPGVDPAPRWILRLHFHANQPSIELQHTFVWDSGARLPVLRELGLRFGVPGGIRSARAPESLGRSRSREVPLGPGRAFSVLQDEHRRRGSGRSHAALIEEGPSGRRPLVESERAAGIVSGLRAGGAGSVTLALRHFWERFPSELRVEPDSLSAWLHTDAGRAQALDTTPSGIRAWIGEALLGQLRTGRHRAQFAKSFEAPSLDPSGVARTHRLLLHFEVGDAEPEPRARAFVSPPSLVADPKWSAASGVLGPIAATDDERFPDREAALRSSYREVAGLIDEWGDYGFLDHGAGPHHAYGVDEEGSLLARPWRYAGLDFGYTRATWLAWLRSGERPYLELARARTHFAGDVLRSHVESRGRRVGDYRFWASGPTVVPWHANARAESGGRPPLLGLGSGFGLDVESLLFDYWLEGDLRSLEIASEVADALAEMVSSSEGPGSWVSVHANRSRWLFQTLADLAVLGEQFGDARLSDAASAIAAVAIDSDSPGGVVHHPAREGGPRLGYPSYLFYKAPWMLRYAESREAAEAERVRQALLRGAEYALRTRSREGRMAGLRLGFGIGPERDLRYLAFGRERADAYVAGQVREPQGRGGYRLPLHGVLANAADRVVSQAALMDSLGEAPESLPIVPVLWKDAKRPAASALLSKPAGEALSAEIVHGDVSFERPDGSPWPVKWRGSPTAYVPEGASGPLEYRRLAIPAEEPAGLYRIRAPWEAALVVLSSDAAALRLEAPEGLHLGREGAPPWSFRFGPGPKQVFASRAAALELLDPQGRVVELRKERGWSRIRGGEGVYRARALGPVFFSASAEGSRYAHGEENAVPLAGVGEAPRLPDPGVAMARVETGALSLRAKGTLRIPADRVRSEQGSIEWWWRPDWDSGALGEGERKGLLAVEGATGSSQLYYRYGVSSKGADVFELRFEVMEEAAAGRGKARRRQSPWLGRGEALRWKAGQRLHLALEWWSDSEGRRYRVLVDGRPLAVKPGAHTSPVWPIPELPRSVRFGPGDGKRGRSFDGTLQAVRISNTPRYLRGARGVPPMPADFDASTSLLCRFTDPNRLCVDAGGRGVGGVSP